MMNNDEILIIQNYLRDIFDDQVETYHSGVTAKRRYEIWEKARSGETKIFVGTRSAILLPDECAIARHNKPYTIGCHKW